MMMESLVSGIVAAPVGTVWALAGDFGNLDYFPLAERVELANGEPVERIVHLRGGGCGRERLIARSETDHQIDYIYIDDPAQPFWNYRAKLRLTPGADRNTTLLSWRSTYEALPESADAVRRFIEVDIYAACIEGLRKICESPG